MKAFRGASEGRIFRALRGPDARPLVLLVGGLALCLLGLGRTPAELGIGMDRLGRRLLGGLALGAVLGFFARTLVTPLARPRSRHGHPLVHSAQPAGDQASRGRKPAEGRET